MSRHDGSGARWLLASNISEGGLFVRTPQPPRVGTRLRLDLEARGQTLRFAEAEVVWSRPVDVTRLSQALPGFGVRFLPLSEESKSLVQHLVDVGGTGRGQAKTVPFSAPDAPFTRTREPLHAPAAAMVEALVPTDKASTGEWAALPPLDANREPKVIVQLSDPPIAFDDEEPMLDRAAVAAHPVTTQPAQRSGSRGGDWIAGLILVAAAALGGLCAWRGLAEPAAPANVNEPVSIITSQPASVAPAPEIASPEGPDGMTAAQVEPEPAAPANPPVASAPRPQPLALPSGAAKAVDIFQRDGALHVAPTLAAGASIARFFTLSSPPRLVIDLDGASPRGAPRVAGRDGVTDVRLGARSGGTRLVFDLARAPAKVIRSADGAEIELR